ncbi:conserved hypothetical protein, partial [Ricinus communis]
RRGGAGKDQGQQAGTDFDGRGDAGRERLPGHALDQPRSGAEGRAGDYLLQQEPGDGPHLGHAPGRARLPGQA